MLNRVKGYEIINIIRIQEIKVEKLKMSDEKVTKRKPRNDKLYFKESKRRKGK